VTILSFDYFPFTPQMVSSLDNWDGSLSSNVKQNRSRITDLGESAGASANKTTVPDERSNILGNNGHGSHDRVAGLDMNYLVCYLFDGICIVAQVTVYLERRVKFE
jgi:hypothetical protein